MSTETSGLSIQPRTWDAADARFKSSTACARHGCVFTETVKSIADTLAVGTRMARASIFPRKMRQDLAGQFVRAGRRRHHGKRCRAAAGEIIARLIDRRLATGVTMDSRHLTTANPVGLVDDLE